MGYNEEQTRAYRTLMSDLTEFDKIKKSLILNKCLTHNKKCKVEANWENEYDLNIIISKYCCLDYAERIFKILNDENRFNSVIIEPI